MTSPTPASSRDLHAAATRISGFTLPVFDALHEVAESCRRDVDLTVERPLDHPDHSAALAPTAEHVLHSQSLITGVGAAIVGKTSTDGSASMAWWIRRAGKVSRKRHVLNPQSDTFYDVRHLRWFRVPMQTGRPALYGPYVDSWGTDDFTLTASLPLTVADHRVGVVAADLDTRRYLDLAEDVLRETGDSVLIDDEGRVVVSSRPDIDIGTRVSALQQPVAQAALTSLPWRVAGLAVTP